MIFSDVQIRIMQLSVNSIEAKDSVLWKVAFNEYNKLNYPALSMSLGACYRKVLNYIIANNSKETVNIVPNDSRTGHGASQ